MMDKQADRINASCTILASVAKILAHVLFTVCWKVNSNYYVHAKISDLLELEKLTVAEIGGV